MKISTILLLSLVILSVTVFSKDEQKPYTGPSEEDVIELDNTNLQSTIYESEDAWLIDLHASWCGHCQTLRPQWAKLATKLKGVIKVAKIDAAQNRQFDQTYALKGYPHIVMVPAGPKDKKIYYVHEGARTAESIYEWAMEKMKTNKGFLVERLISEDAWNQYCIDLQSPLCVIVFLPTLIDSTPQERKVYLQVIRGVVNNFRDKPVSFLWAQAGDHQQLQDQFSMFSGFPTVLLINPMRRVFSLMKSSFTEQNFEQWLKDILNRKGGRKFGHYSKSLVFGQVKPQDIQSQLPTGGDEINVDDGENFEQQEL